MRTTAQRLNRKARVALAAIIDRNPVKLANVLVGLVELALVATHVALDSPVATLVLIAAGIAAPPAAGWIVARVTWAPATVRALKPHHLSGAAGELPMVPSSYERDNAAAHFERVTASRARARARARAERRHP